MNRTLRGLVWAMGVACVAIGTFHFALGIHSVPGEGGAGATVDSRERFYGALFFGYGLVWIWTARRSPVPASVVRWLAVIFLLGGVGRLLSMALVGQPHWFQIALTVIELALPAVFFWLADADEKRIARPVGSRPDPTANVSRPLGHD
ncbi:DUF4345 domain-containing protein [Nocardia otitidiscaviarum]|uniref:DUF4345 domain-containing protein n=1 Tax=Nocardia otitidiscaviarum TaxID=1823 RepID=UPI0004A6AA45|nr:DUF4345 domain-containing protein [Nocardia otitidiscaviarum]MBF6132914.1 DUF4345 domain-containing protein [Nocardia otitidiscaviarum]MBF6486309.1 DUF4345 domain-containing protein [Nocardia otitidiscaviarum]